MNWQERRGRYYAESEDGQIGYNILPKKNGRYFVKAYLGGGAEHRLPFQDFTTADEAKAWVEEYEHKRAEQNAKYADEKPIKF